MHAFRRDVIRAERRRGLEGLPGRSDGVALLSVEADQPFEREQDGSGLDLPGGRWTVPCSARWWWTTSRTSRRRAGRWWPSTRRRAKSCGCIRSARAAAAGAESPGSAARTTGKAKIRKDRRIFVTTGGYLHAIDALTGKTVDSFADHGKLDLKIGIDRAPIPLASRTPGRIFENLIILGSFPGEGYLAPPGDLRAFDVRTGKLAWVFHTIPHRGRTWVRHVAARTPTSTWAAWMCGAKSPWTRSAESRIFRCRPPSMNCTAAIARATTCSPTACWRWMRAPANICGTSRPCITISGITIRRRRRNS